MGSLKILCLKFLTVRFAFRAFDAVPLARSHGLAYIPYGLHLTFPFEFGSITLKFRRFTCYTSAAFQLRHLPYTPSYVFLLPFGVVFFASCSILPPLGDSGCLAASLLIA